MGVRPAGGVGAYLMVWCVFLNPQPSPFEGKPAPETSAAKPSSPELNPAAEPMDADRPGTPVPAVEVPEPMETSKQGTATVMGEWDTPWYLLVILGSLS